MSSIAFRNFRVQKWLVSIVSIVLLGFSARAQDSTNKVYTVGNGALPWYDRTNWAMADVPDSLKGDKPVPQQSCTSRALVVTGDPKSILIGVCKCDTDAFEKMGYKFEKTGETFSVTDADKGQTVPYIVYRVTSPPSQLGKGLAAGLIFLKTEDAGTNHGSPPSASTIKTTFDVGDGRNLAIFLLMGQSNMVGRDTTGIESQVPDSRIGYMDWTGQWKLAVEPIHRGGTGFGPGTFFAKAWLKISSDAKVGLVPCAAGGTPLSRWEKGGDLYAAALAQAKIASNSGRLCGVLWHQGETDAASSELASTYEARLTKMFQNFRQDIGKPDLPIVIGQLGDFVAGPGVNKVRAAIRTLPRDLSNVGYVDAAGLKDKGDHLHFNVESQKIMGERYAAAMLVLADKEAPKT